MTRNYLFARGINACAYLKLMYFFVRFFKFLCLLGLSLEYHTYVYISILFHKNMLYFLQQTLILIC